MIKKVVLAIVVFLTIGLLVSGIPILKFEEPGSTILLKSSPGVENQDFVVIKVPAVTEDDVGTMAQIRVDMIPGTGRTLMEIDNILFFEDTQNSIRLAKAMAERLTGTELTQNDIIYSVRTNATAIEGSSAGAAIALSTIALIENRPLNESVTITGLLKPDGSIGKVGNVLEKARVSKEYGYDLILVPPGQKIQEEAVKREVCTKIIFKDICRTIVNQKIIDIEQAVGISVVEVSNIFQAANYMII
jgi:uncharacterized protein